jgi:hypothetical protein
MTRAEDVNILGLEGHHPPWNTSICSDQLGDSPTSDWCSTVRGRMCLNGRLTKGLTR